MRYYPLVRHPRRFVWDFWYWLDRKKEVYNLLYLNADYSLVESNQHHFWARVGYAQTQDFVDIDWIDDDVFHARVDGWDNTSIWTGDLVRQGKDLTLFYTSRDRTVDDSMTQYVGMARGNTADVTKWERDDDFLLKADGSYYETKTIVGDGSVHAWRDPFCFRQDGKVRMLIAAKSRALPVGRKGCVGLLEAADESLTKWHMLPPIFAPGYYSECEVPRIYRNAQGDSVLSYSMWGKCDFCPYTNKQGGYHAVLLDEGKPWVLLPESSGLYACHIIPELEGDIVGFDIKRGGLQRVGAKTGLLRMHA